MATGTTPATRNVRINGVMWSAPRDVVDEIDRLVNEVAEMSEKLLAHNGFVRRVEKQASEVQRLTAEIELLRKDKQMFYEVEKGRAEQAAIDKDFIEQYQREVTLLTAEIEQLTKIAKAADLVSSMSSYDEESDEVDPCHMVYFEELEDALIPWRELTKNSITPEDQQEQQQ